MVFGGFFAVLRYLANFFAVLRCSEPPNVPLIDENTADNAKQGHCVVVEISNTHPGGATSLIYGRKINEEGSGVGEPYQLLTKDLIGTWEDEEVKAENVQVGSIVKYVQVGDEFVFQGNTKRPRQVSSRLSLIMFYFDLEYLAV